MPVNAIYGPPEPDDLEGPWREEIERRLNRDRPARYTNQDNAWMEPTRAWARVHSPYDPVTAQLKVMHDAVMAIEKNANRKANGKLKQWALGQAPLFWDDLGPLPFTLDRSRNRGLRIRFDAAIPEDFEKHADNIESNAQERKDAEDNVAEGLRDIAHRTRVMGFQRCSQLGDLPRR
jgi:hypothetical protein